MKNDSLSKDFYKHLFTFVKLFFTKDKCYPASRKSQTKDTQRVKGTETYDFCRTCQRKQKWKLCKSVVSLGAQKRLLSGTRIHQMFETLLKLMKEACETQTTQHFDAGSTQNNRLYKSEESVG